jgi:hypothetical protein
MAVTAAKTFIGGEVLTASDLNTLNTNILNQQNDLANPRLKQLDMDRHKLVLDEDGDTSITADTNDQIDFEVGGSDVLVVTATDVTFLGDSLVFYSEQRHITAPAFKTNQHRITQLDENRTLESQVLGF